MWKKSQWPYMRRNNEKLFHKATFIPACRRIIVDILNLGILKSMHTLINNLFITASHITLKIGYSSPTSTGMMLNLTKESIFWGYSINGWLCSIGKPRKYSRVELKYGAAELDGVSRKFLATMSISRVTFAELCPYFCETTGSTKTRVRAKWEQEVKNIMRSRLSEIWIRFGWEKTQ